MVHDTPAFVEIYSNPEGAPQQLAATILLPSAEQANEFQVVSGALVWVHD
jgi:hypothetical protein